MLLPYLAGMFLLAAGSDFPSKATLGHTGHSLHAPQNTNTTIRLPVCMVALQAAHKNLPILHTCQVCIESTVNIAVLF